MDVRKTNGSFEEYDKAKLGIKNSNIKSYPFFHYFFYI